MKNHYRTISIILFSTCLVLAFFLQKGCGDSSENIQLKIDKARYEEWILFLEAEKEKSIRQIDSLSKSAARLDSLVKQQNNNPEIIHKKHEKEFERISRLDADSALLFFSGKISEKSNH